MHRFSNNAVSALANDLASDALAMILIPGGGAPFNVFVGDEGETDGTMQAVTLTHPDSPGVYEVVHMISRGVDVFYIERGLEGTLAQAWPAGTKVSANVTAGMLGDFIQRNGRDEGPGSAIKMVTTGALVMKDSRSSSEESASSANTGFVVNAVTRLPRTWAVGGNSVLTQARAKSTSQDLQSNAYESMGQTVPVDLGTPRVWTPGQQYHRSAVVVPPTPNGMQYWLHILSVKDLYTTDSALSFNPNPYSRTRGGNTGVGPSEWESRPVDIPMEVSFSFPDWLEVLITEVGFISHQYDASSPPTVTIGTGSDPTRYASAAALSMLTDVGTTIHRIPVSAGGELARNLIFTADTAAIGGTCRGVFYWKGCIIESAYEMP